MRWIYLSPHLDDAVLSAGGLMYEQTRVGLPVEIWTIMCGFPDDVELSDFAKSLHRQWGTSSARETVHLRRAENDEAASRVGAKAVYLDFLDCIYRRGPSGEALYTNAFAPPDKAEADLSARMARAISVHLQPDDVLVCPLALGGHVDHVIVRQAAERLGRVLLHNADIPYLLNKPRKLWRNTIGMKEFVWPVSEAGLEAWMEASRAYASQIQLEFQSLERMKARVTAYWAERKGLRLWQAQRKRLAFWKVADHESSR